VWQVGTIRVGRIDGIAIDLHITFPLVFLWAVWQGWTLYHSVWGVAYWIVLTLLLFVCILLHELGHGLQAKMFRLATRRIILLPIGGLAQLASPPAYASHELLIALAGPMANLGLAGLFGIALFLSNPFASAGWLENLIASFYGPPSLNGVLVYLLSTNLVLFISNMLPAFPMDGGRVLRAGLAILLNYELATRLVAWLGRIMAAAMGAFGLLGWPPAGFPPNLLFILFAVMIYFGAEYEEMYVRQQRALVRVEVGAITRRLPEALAPWDAITGNLTARLFQKEQVVPVLVEDRVVGLLTYHDVRRLQDRGATFTVAHAMRTHFPCLRLTDTLWVALQEMNALQLPMLPVVDNGTFQGMAHLDDIKHAWKVRPRRQGENAALASGDTLTQ
jgi:Zn-dependent protease